MADDLPAGKLYASRAEGRIFVFPVSLLFISPHLLVLPFTTFSTKFINICLEIFVVAVLLVFKSTFHSCQMVYVIEGSRPFRC